MKKIILVNIFVLLMAYTVLSVSLIQSIEIKPIRMVLKTDKTIYFLGENVTIIMENIGDTTVEIGGYPAWIIFKCPENEAVYPAIFAFLLWGLAPNEENRMVWNQYDEYNGKLVEPGVYVVRDTQGWGLSATFVISNLPKDLGHSNGGCGGGSKYLV